MLSMLRLLLLAATELTVCAPFLPAQLPTPGVRVVRVAAGPRGGVTAGEYRLDEERTTFDRSSQSQAVVHFQWEGTSGHYRMTGRWRGPSGLSTSSEFDYRTNGPRFGAYWVLPLSPETPLGTWTLDALIDGVPAGSYSIEVTEGGPATSRRAPLSPAELYDRLGLLFVSLKPRQEAGLLALPRAGFIGPAGRWLPLSVPINGSEDLTATFSDGSTQAVVALRAWSRLQDWALLAMQTPALEAPPHASAAPQVGDRCYSVYATAEGRALAECSVAGRGTGPDGGARWLLDFYPVAPPRGAPVLNQRGELLALVSGTRDPAFSSAMEVAAANAGLRSVPAVPYRPRQGQRGAVSGEHRRPVRAPGDPPARRGGIAPGGRWFRGSPREPAAVRRARGVLRR